MELSGLFTMTPYFEGSSTLVTCEMEVLNKGWFTVPTSFFCRNSIINWIGFVDSYHNGTLVSVSLMERLQFQEREVADHVTVEDKEGRVILAKNVASKSKRTSYKGRKVHQLVNGLLLFPTSSCFATANDLAVQDGIDQNAFFELQGDMKVRSATIPVPRGSVSTENVILTLYRSSYFWRIATITSGL